MLDRLDALRKASFPEDQEIALIAAKAYLNILHAAAWEDEWDRVFEMQRRFDVLRKALPEDQEIALIDAHATYRIETFAISAGEMTLGHEMLARYESLLKANFGDLELEISDGKVTTIQNLRDDLYQNLNT